MPQDQAILLAFKAAEVASVAAIVVFVACYTAWAPWWRDAIGRTIVIKDLLLLIAFVPSILAMFLQFSRFTSRVAAWTDVAVIGLIAPVMIWRVLVFRKIHRGGKPPGDGDGEEEEAS